MKRSLLALIPLLAFAVLMAACGGKNSSGPVTVKKFDTYDDAILKFAVRYPSDWSKGIQPGSQVVFYTSTSIENGFTKYEPDGQVGAKIDVHAMRGGQEAMDQSISELKVAFTDTKVFQPPQQTTLNGLPATKLSYSFDVDQTKFTAERYYVIKDSVVTYFETAVIGNYADYASVFDTARAAFKPGMIGPRMARDTGGAMRDSQVVDPPAATMQTYANARFGIQYPTNFNVRSEGVKGALSSTSFSGTRIDSYFQVDVIDAKDMDMDAIVAQVKRNYGDHSPTSANVGSAKGVVFTFNGAHDVSGRAYLALSGKFLYRVTLNWYGPQKDAYLPVFEKAVATFQPK